MKRNKKVKKENRRVNLEGVVGMNIVGTLSTPGDRNPGESLEATVNTYLCTLLRQSIQLTATLTALRVAVKRETVIPVSLLT